MHLFLLAATPALLSPAARLVTPAAAPTARAVAPTMIMRTAPWYYQQDRGAIGSSVARMTSMSPYSRMWGDANPYSAEERAWSRGRAWGFDDYYDDYYPRGGWGGGYDYYDRGGYMSYPRDRAWGGYGGYEPYDYEDRYYPRMAGGRMWGRSRYGYDDDYDRGWGGRGRGYGYDRYDRGWGGRGRGYGYDRYDRYDPYY